MIEDLMTRTPRARAALSGVIACGLLAASAFATGAMADETDSAAIDEMIATKLEQVNTYFAEHREDFDREAFQAFMAELVADVPIDELGPAQISRIQQMLYSSDEAMDAAIARLESLADGTDGEAGLASAMYAGLVSSRDQSSPVEAIRAALTHPGLAEAMKSPEAAGLMGQLAYLDESDLEALAWEILAAGHVLNADLPPTVVLRMDSYLTTLNKMGDLVDDRVREQVRLRLIELCKAAATESAGDPETERYAEYLRKRVDFLDGAFARGKLIDHTAPVVAFDWVSGDGDLSTLADLEGKVVVLDFWATWCGPCVASFPNVRELQERYNGYDVEIVGVTSLQGTHYPKDGAPVKCEDDPAKEYGLMADYIDAMDITWTIAFSSDDVFNPNFGVRGIPHVAIIDAEGKVRHNGLHPAGPKAEKTKKIDALLAEAGLPVPAPLPETGSADG